MIIICCGDLALMQILAPVLMVISSWLEGQTCMRVVWRSVSTIHGEQYVMTAGTAMMHWLSADNLATPPLVYIIHPYLCTR